MKRSIKRAIGAFYSFAADKLYEPVIVKIFFPFFGGDLNHLAMDQGQRAAQEAGGGLILDVPAGTGFFTLPVARLHDGILVATDYAHGMVAETQRAAGAEGLANVTVVRSDIHRLPFRTGTFSVTLCTNGLQVIPGLEPSVKELARTLGGGGALYVSLISLPLSLLLPKGARPHLPTFLRSGGEVADALAREGLDIRDVRRSRLATLIEARKPPAA